MKRKHEKPNESEGHRCPFTECEYHCLDAKDMRRHIKRHTGERNALCPICRKAFSRSDNMRRHYKKSCQRSEYVVQEEQAIRFHSIPEHI